jgi:TetR/AcrR family transcriptional regulator, cholesterol catabolism regulator
MTMSTKSRYPAKHGADIGDANGERSILRAKLYQAGSRRSEIAQAGVELFFEKGYHATGMRELADSLGLTPSALYNHFPGKQELLSFILEETMKALIEEVSSRIDPNADPITKLKEAIQAHLEFHAAYIKESFVSDSELRGLDGETRRRVIACRDAYEKIYRDILSEGVETGAFAAINPKMMTFAIVALCTGITIWYKAGGPWSLEEIADSYSALVIDGLRARKARPGLHEQGFSSSSGTEMGGIESD